jgi:DNA-binding MarR family transcriptional regulator
MAKARPVRLEDVHEVRDRCICLSAQRAARHLARLFDRVFRELGLTNGQFSLMVAMSGGKPWRQNELAEFLAMDRTTLTAALQKLERRGLVKVAADEEDRRARRMSLTEAGKRLVAEAIPLWREEHAKLERELTAGRAGDVRKSLRLLFP